MITGLAGSAGDLIQRAPRRGHRGDQPEQILLVTHNPEVADHLGAVSDRAGQVRQHPARSWTRRRRDASAFDSPAVRPMLSANARAGATPACDTMPVPSAVTRRPFIQPVVFAYQVLHDLGRYGSQQPLSSQVRSTFHGRRTGQLTQRREFSGLAGHPEHGNELRPRASWSWKPVRHCRARRTAPMPDADFDRLTCGGAPAD
jgi:hypothetical protein